MCDDVNNNVRYRCQNLRIFTPKNLISKLFNVNIESNICAPVLLNRFNMLHKLLVKLLLLSSTPLMNSIKHEHLRKLPYVIKGYSLNYVYGSNLGGQICFNS